METRSCTTIRSERMTGAQLNGIVKLIISRFRRKDYSDFEDEGNVVVLIQRESLPSLVAFGTEFATLEFTLPYCLKLYSSISGVICDALLPTSRSFSVHYYVSEGHRQYNLKRAFDLFVGYGREPNTGLWFLVLSIGEISKARRDISYRRGLFDTWLQLIGAKDQIHVQQEKNKLTFTSEPGLELHLPIEDHLGPSCIRISGFPSLGDVQNRLTAFLDAFPLSIDYLRFQYSLDLPDYERLRESLTGISPWWTITLFGRLRQNIAIYASTRERPEGPVRILLFQWYETCDEFVDGEVVRLEDGVRLELITNVSDPPKLVREVTSCTGVEFSLAQG